MHFDWPQFILVGIMSLNLIRAFVKDGEMETRKISSGSYLLSFAILMGLLYWGGFFKGAC